MRYVMDFPHIWVYKYKFSLAHMCIIQELVRNYLTGSCFMYIRMQGKHAAEAAHGLMPITGIRKQSYCSPLI
jgi:hypothetical protein